MRKFELHWFLKAQSVKKIEQTALQNVPQGEPTAQAWTIVELNSGFFFFFYTPTIIGGFRHSMVHKLIKDVTRTSRSEDIFNDFETFFTRMGESESYKIFLFFFCQTRHWGDFGSFSRAVCPNTEGLAVKIPLTPSLCPWANPKLLPMG